MADEHSIYTFQDGVERVTEANGTLHWTLSLYIDKDHMPADFAGKFRSENKVANQQKFPAEKLKGVPRSTFLRDAIDPLFNDISDRERLGEVQDYLLDTPGAQMWREIEIDAPNEITWETEGVSNTALLAKRGPRKVWLRRFWYVHLNGALSYHLSFLVRYTHTIEDYYFLSLLQKLTAPKEFVPKDRTEKRYVWQTQKPLDLQPLDTVTVIDQGQAPRTFWRWVRDQFNEDADSLFDTFSLGAPRIPAKHAAHMPKSGATKFQQLLSLEKSVETPGLYLPSARVMFFFYDEEFFDALLPPPIPGASRPERRDMLDRAAFEQDAALVETHIDAKTGACTLDSALFAQVDIARLRYYFLAGFCQNIIDFMRQDASEILDSTDPVYPVDPEDVEEAFFVRYANPRALTTFVKSCRSLEVGNTYIGTCPYAFLIHVTAMHNEFAVRDYEDETDQLVQDVRAAAEADAHGRAVEMFYEFRTNQFTDYQRYKYANIFRYDTEKKVFAAMERIRGVARKEAYLKEIVDTLEKQSGDSEARLSKRDEDRLNGILLVVGFYSIFQVAFEAVNHLDAILPINDAGKHFWLQVTMWLAGATTVATLAFLGLASWHWIERALKVGALKRRR